MLYYTLYSSFILESYHQNFIQIPKSPLNLYNMNSNLVLGILSWQWLNIFFLYWHSFSRKILEKKSSIMYFLIMTLNHLFLTTGHQSFISRQQLLITTLCSQVTMYAKGRKQPMLEVKVYRNSSSKNVCKAQPMQEVKVH